MRLSDLRRLYQIARLLIRYELVTLIPLYTLKLPLYLAGRLFWFRDRAYRHHPLGVRLRLALQELGPIWIKLGQMLSTRRDLLPVAVADQLALLQDQVPPFDATIAQATIEQLLGGPLTQWFDHFDEQPLACASVAQVHTAYLKVPGRAVVLKVIRPGVRALLLADIRLLYGLARFIQCWWPDGQRLRPLEVVQEYEKTLLDELNLLREAANAIQLRRNFTNSPLLYIPEVFVDYCREGLLVMERIHGIPISDIPKLQAQGIDLQRLAERGVEIFFTQVFRDSLFHADMHPGNIFVSYEHPHDPQYIGVDYGIVGSLSRQDQHYLASNFLAFFNRDYRQVATLHVTAGWVPRETNIEAFEAAIRTICEPIFQKPLGEISFGQVLLSLFSTAQRFNMPIQPQLLLLQKTLLYVEGLGRQLYPQLDLWTTAKPFLESWMRDQMGWSACWRRLKEKAPLWLDQLPQLPGLLHETLQQQQCLQRQLLQQSAAAQHRQRDRVARYWSQLGTTLLLCAALLLAAQIAYWVYPAIIGVAAWLISGFMLHVLTRGV
ncbi:ubiquinone biosynthesis regulatory protein kinase UbiB [unidentified bacterial endosymbiont]|uniref:ubiquinone biosynthesis regulatory protein kinase UbiB n=1 Tax=unidentified bacterial endosymbiont TaxID=2355 RepID=UPI00209DFF33|nr:ubiquinone biosynthesis regulatory protein kinase UbiB [unidentified bacterial endosymbiont]